MADNLDEVFGMDDAVEAVEPVVDAAPETEVVEAPQESEPEPVVEQEQPQPSKDWVVPGAAMLEERERAKALERELNDLKAQRQQPAQQPTIPDPYDDPQGFADAQQQLVDQRITQVRFEMSDRFARQAHGAETVEKAIAWAQEKAQADPSFAISYMRDPDPIGHIVQQHKRDAMLGTIGNAENIDEFIKSYISDAQNAQRLGLASAPAPAPAAVVPASASAPRVPRSLASQATVASDVRQTATGPLVGVDALFG